MKKFIICFLLSLIQWGGYAQEWNGPFSSWNIATPLTLDSAIQKAKINHKVIYLTHGSYNVDHIDLHALMNVRLIGEDPATTFINYTGAGGAGTLLDMSGSAYSQVSRITFNGGAGCLYLVDQSTNQGDGFFDSGNEYSDCVFQNCWYGLYGGRNNFGFAETAVNRCKFLNSFKGIQIGNWNALDLWIRNCTFSGLYQGVSNYDENGSGAGNFKIYNSIFSNNGTDVRIQQTGAGEFSLRDNYSTSATFLNAGFTSNPAAITLSGNRVGNISVRNQGAVTAYDNSFNALAQDQGGNADLISFHNSGSVTASGRLLSFGGNPNAIVPVIPQTPPLIVRPTFEAGSNIQAIINEASAMHSKAVVHFPDDMTLNVSIPANSDIQIVGDGDGDWWGTKLHGHITLNGPSKVQFRDINTMDCIVELNNADQIGGRVYFSQVEFHNNKYGLSIAGLSHTKVLAINSRFSQADIGIKIDNSTNQNIFYSGLFWNNGCNLKLNNASSLIRDYWDEGNATGTYAQADNSKLSIEGSHLFELPGVNPNQFQISNSKLAIVGNFISNKVSGSGTYLGIGNTQEHDDYLNASGDIRSFSDRALDPNAGTSGSGSYGVNNVGVCDSSFIASNLEDLRNLKEDTIAETGDGVTDVRFYRCWVYNNLTGSAISIQGSSSLPIQLMAFTGKCTPTGALLSWATSQELNSSYFLIEGSNDLNFREVGQVKAAGTSGTVLNYSLNVPAFKYYRLSEVDKDGHKEIYKIINSACSIAFKSYEVFDMLGHLLKKGMGNIDLKQYPKGIYLIRIDGVTSKYIN